jgi:hypothetical protein
VDPVTTRERLAATPDLDPRLRERVLAWIDAYIED